MTFDFDPASGLPDPQPSKPLPLEAPRAPISAADGPAHRFFVTPFFESSQPALATTVRECMAPIVATCRPEDTVYDAACKMLDTEVSALPVIDQGKVVGILSLSDLLYRLKTPHGTISDAIVEWLGGSQPDLRKHVAYLVKDAMTQPAITIADSETVAAAARCLIQRRIHQLPVVSEDRLVGMVTRRDLVGVLAAWAEQVLTESPR